MYGFRPAMLVALALLLTGCASEGPREEVLAHPNYDVSSFSTYTWSDEPVAVIGLIAGAETVQLETRAKQLVNEQLQARGYRLVERRNAELIVSTMVGAIEQTAFSEHVVDSQRYYGAQVRWSQENDFLRGAVSIILRHRDSEDIVWQGSVGQRLENDPGRARSTLKGFVARIGELLPPAR